MSDYRDLVISDQAAMLLSAEDTIVELTTLLASTRLLVSVALERVSTQTTIMARQTRTIARLQGHADTLAANYPPLPPLTRDEAAEVLTELVYASDIRWTPFDGR